MRPHTGLGVSPGPVSRHHVAQWEETEGRFSVLSQVHTCKMLGQFVHFEKHFKRFKSGKIIIDLSKTYKFGYIYSCTKAKKVKI